MKLPVSAGALIVGIAISTTVLSADPANCTFQNGNVNADARVDLTDAIYLLSYLYQGGRAPKPQFVADNECLVSLREDLATVLNAYIYWKGFPKFPQAFLPLRVLFSFGSFDQFLFQGVSL